MSESLIHLRNDAGDVVAVVTITELAYTDGADELTTEAREAIADALGEQAVVTHP